MLMFTLLKEYEIMHKCLTINEGEQIDYWTYDSSNFFDGTVMNLIIKNNNVRNCMIATNDLNQLMLLRLIIRQLRKKINSLCWWICHIFSISRITEGAQACYKFSLRHVTHVLYHLQCNTGTPNIFSSIIYTNLYLIPY